MTTPETSVQNPKQLVVRPVGEVSRQAQRDCNEWLVSCLRLGWRRQHLDALETLWWQHHNAYGDLERRPPVSLEPPKA